MLHWTAQLQLRSSSCSSGPRASCALRPDVPLHQQLDRDERAADLLVFCFDRDVVETARGHHLEQTRRAGGNRPELWPAVAQDEAVSSSTSPVDMSATGVARTDEHERADEAYAAACWSIGARSAR